MWLENKNTSKDLMTQVRIIKDKIKGECYVDKIGIGAGVVSRCQELGLRVEGINWGQPATEPKRFANRKAENFWKFKRWVENNGKILWEDGWEALKQIKYKINSSGKILMEPKEYMRERGIDSPDIVDSGALTFNETTRPDIY